MRIIVIQRRLEYLRDIKDSVAKINPVLAEEIVYTLDEGWVMKEVEDGRPVFIVSGEVLGDDGIGRGSDLAQRVKRLNSQALFVIYSTVPVRNDAVDGVILKEFGSGSLLAKILTEFNGTTRRDLQAKYPGI